MKIVLKIGGNEIDDPVFLEKISRLVENAHRQRHEIVLVHGGGKEITNLTSRLGIETKFIDGFRYTDRQTLDAVEMVLSGSINKRLVKSLQRNGANAVGLSGVDGKILTAKKIDRNGKDIGYVGEVHAVNTAVLEELMEAFIVVLSPISIQENSDLSLNVNADYAAAAVAAALKSEMIIFLSNVPGVLNNGTPIPILHESEFLNLKDTGIIAGGMVPKVEAALRALDGGTRMAFITDADGASQIISGQMAGTEVLA